MNINVEIYNNLEKENIKKYSNYLLQAFSTVTFSAINFKSTIDDETDLWKYADTMKEFTFEGNINCLKSIISERETMVLQKVYNDVKIYLKNILKLNVDGRNCLSGSLISLVYINRIFENLQKKGTVIEFGPGNGYLGLLLAQEGYSYYSTDISQAFYIYQNHLYSEILGDKFIEGALSSNLRPINGSIVHLPWWKWVDNHVELPPFDIAIFNHCLVEMHPNALKFALAKLKNLRKKNSEGSPLFIFIEGFGHEGFRKSEDIVKILYEMGYEIIENRSIRRSSDKSDVNVIALFEYKSNAKPLSYDIFPYVNFFNKNELIMSIKSFMKWTLGIPYEKRYQKLKFVNRSKYFFTSQNIIDQDNIKKIFTNGSDIKKTTEDEDFLIYCNGDI